MAEWYVRAGGKVHGPLDSRKLKQLASAGRINGTTEVSQVASGPFVPAANVKGLFALTATPSASTSPAPAPVAARTGTPVAADASTTSLKAPLSDAVDAVKATAGYVGRTLLPGERVVYEGRLHWFLFLRPVIWFVLAICFPIFGYERGDPQAMLGSVGACVFFLAVAILSLVLRVLTYLTSEFVVTNKRVVLKQGFIRRNTLELMLNKVDSLGVDQGLIGRLFNFGTVKVAVATEKQRFAFLADPLEFRRQVQLMQANA
jgi:membrane protein YdbS with pleckstrin-like domain